MTVEELYDELGRLMQKHDCGDRQVVLSRDSEGNGFDYLALLELGQYEHGELFMEEDAEEGQEPVVVLWP